jgi:hypothetical protein
VPERHEREHAVVLRPRATLEWAILVDAFRLVTYSAAMSLPRGFRPALPAHQSAATAERRYLGARDFFEASRAIRTSAVLACISVCSSLTLRPSLSI